jgi:Protein of unknown function (DUF2442)
VSEFVDVTAVRVLGGYELELTWADGLVSTIDVEPYLFGPVFEPLRRDPAVFATVTVDPEAGTVVWPATGADISPEELRLKSRPARTPTRPGATEVSARFRGLPPMDPQSLRRDVDAAVDQRLHPMRTATREEVLAARDELRRLAADHLLSRPRVDDDGAVVVTMPTDDPGYRTLKAYAAAAAEVAGIWINIVADDAQAASADTTEL